MKHKLLAARNYVSFDPRGLTLDMSFQTIALLMLSLFCKKMWAKNTFNISPVFQLRTLHTSNEYHPSIYIFTPELCKTVQKFAERHGLAIMLAISGDLGTRLALPRVEEDD